MNYRIFRDKQEEYWDIWGERAIVFPEDKPLEEVFTEENLRKLLTSYSSKEEYSTYTINFENANYVDVRIYRKGEDTDYYNFVSHYEFVEMFSVLIV